MTWTESDERSLALLPVAFAGRADVQTLFPDPAAWGAFLKRNARAARMLQLTPPAALSDGERREWCRSVIWQCAAEIQGEFRSFGAFVGYLDGVASGRVQAPCAGAPVPPIVGG